MVMQYNTKHYAFGALFNGQLQKPQGNKSSNVLTILNEHLFETCWNAYFSF